MLIVSFTKHPRLSRLSFTPRSKSSRPRLSLSISRLEPDSGLDSSLIMVRGDMVGGVLKLVNGVLLALTFADPGPGLSRSGLNTESEEILRSALCRPVSVLDSRSRDALPPPMLLLKLESESLRGEKSIEERLSLLLDEAGNMLSSFTELNIFSSAFVKVSSFSSVFTTGSLFSFPSSCTVLSEGADFW